MIDRGKHPWKYKHGMARTRTYHLWAGMKQRCRGSTAIEREYYVARGIKLCERWKDFAAFFEDMGECPPGMELDRIDNDGDYEPGNCRWATHRDNLLNTHRRTLVTVAGRQLPLKVACTDLGLSYEMVRSRIRRGWSPQAALANRL